MNKNNKINLGEMPVCSEATILPVIATDTGTWAFMTSFNGAYQYIQFTATVGEQLVVPAKLNEDYTYTFKLYKPDNTLLNDGGYTAKTIPMLPDIDYVCPISDSASFSTGKIQFEATKGQIEVAYTALAGVKQLAVFIEGAMRHEGAAVDEYVFTASQNKVSFNTALNEGQKITILYFK